MALALALSLAGCTMVMPIGKPLTAEGGTTKDGIVLEVEYATVTLPAGAVAVGTAVTLSMDDAGTPPSASSPSTGVPSPEAKDPEVQNPAAKDPASTDPASTDPAATLSGGQLSEAALLVPVSRRLAVTVGQDLAEGAAMTVTMELSELSQLPETPGITTGTASLALAHLRSGETEPDLVRVAWTAERNAISARVPAGGTFWAVHADIPQLLRTAANTVAATAQVAVHKPECLDKPASASGMSFKAAKAEGIWTCLREHNGMLVVAVAADSAVPMRLAATEKQAGTAVLDAKGLPPYFHQILAPLLEQHKHLAPAMPGASVEYETAAAGVEHQDWELRPYPAMFLLNRLAAMVQATLDAGNDPGAVDATRTAECVAPLLEGSKEKTTLEESWAVPFVRGFMECVAGSLEISPRMDVLLGALNAVPEFVAGSAVKQWDGLAAGAGSTLVITGELEWATYSGTINNAKISFEHPVAWTVMDGSVNQQFAGGNALVVYDHSGNRKATLEVLGGVHASGPFDFWPVASLGTVPGAHPLSSGRGFEVRSVAMDLSADPALRTKYRLDGNVQLSISLAGPPADGKAPAEMAAGMLTGAVAVETGVRSPVQNQTQRFVMFSHSDAFDTMEQVREFAKGGEFAAIQKMLASFKG